MDEQSTPVSADALSSSLGNLLKDPALLKSLGSILGSTASSAESTASTDHQSPTDGLANALSDPNLMAKLPQVMALLQPMLRNNTKPADDIVPSLQDSSTEALPTLLSSSQRPASDHCRDDLLLALKPFLSPGRCEAVDTILRLSKLGSVLKHLQ